MASVAAWPAGGAHLAHLAQDGEAHHRNSSSCCCPRDPGPGGSHVPRHCTQLSWSCTESGLRPVPAGVLRGERGLGHHGGHGGQLGPGLPGEGGGGQEAA